MNGHSKPTLVGYALTTCLFFASLGEAQNPVELGKVAWQRDFDKALDEAGQEKKPLLVLFQEVPGWKTCKDFGAQVLSHPLIVDAIENSFIPLCVYNNTTGDADARVLKAFKEPSWNNPVVRILDARKKDLIKRIADSWTLEALAQGMVEALKKARCQVPPYLDILAKEETARARRIETAVFGMGWFWVGEARLGLMEGVISTLPGFLAQGEVVEVEFDPEVIPYEKLVVMAKEAGCTDKVYTRTDDQQRLAKKILGKAAIRNDEKIRPDKEPKYYLLQTSLKFIPMTGLQAARINGRINDPSHKSLLSPGQLKILKAVEANPDAGWKCVIGNELQRSWAECEKIQLKRVGQR